MTPYSITRHALLRFQWYRFRFRLRRSAKTQLQGPFVDPEQFVRALLAQEQSRSFLEVGIGSSANLGRLRVMAAHDVRYTGCDFEPVCDLHQQQIEQHPELVTAKIRFLRNSAAGTYSWTLFELLRAGETFDVIYLDGHHTFYVDSPALMLAHFLLKPGGIFLLDDVTWTLNLLKHVLTRSFAEWRFYRGAYDFSQYDDRQQALPHVGMLAQTILLDRLGYSKLEKYSTPHWWALRKPAEQSLLRRAG